tara:strand:+ start:1030 stop:1452 length:423 start_codon:yes stop_codon:yes gene_type:complete
MIKINDSIKINDKKIIFKALRSSGAGGQHVNKVSTGIMLEYDLKKYKYPSWFIETIMGNIPSHQFTGNNIIKIKSTKHKSQYRNRIDALNKLINIFKKSSVQPKKRRLNPIPKNSKEHRIKLKKQNSEKKILRRSPNLND